MPMNRLEIAAEDEGFESVEAMLEAGTFDSIAVGICTDCNTTNPSVEPDCTGGYCEGCNGYNVQSVLIIAGII